jgi:[ribosomal protein S5]-alanine N-acetyltransferase
VIDCDAPVAFEGGWFRALRLEDAHLGYVEGLNDPEVNRFLVTVRRSVQTLDGVEAFIRHNRESPDSLLIGIWAHGFDKHCGTIRLHGIEQENRTGYIGICLFDRRVWGRGLATRAIGAVTQWAQTHLHLRWIEAGVYEGNERSERAFRSAGYDWVYDIPDKYLYEGKPRAVRVFAARNLG